MTLTLGSGPLGGSPGALNFSLDAAPAHRILFEPYGRRLRAVVAGRTVLDSTRAHLLHETGIPPVAYVPFEDIDPALLTRTGKQSHCPFKGDASYWTLTAGEATLEDLIWAYEEPMEGAEWLRGYAALYWSRVDELYVEDDRQLGHLRDPYHRVDVHESSRKVRVTAGGRVVAETSRPMMVFETGVPPRAYIPRADVAPGLLRASDKRTHCPYKGEASYWHVDGIEDGAWSYEAPLPEALRAAGHVSFHGEGIEMEVDGAD